MGQTDYPIKITAETISIHVHPLVVSDTGVCILGKADPVLSLGARDRPAIGVVLVHN
jgi:hypothetical protein